MFGTNEVRNGRTNGSKKTRAWWIAVAVLLCALLAACNPDEVLADIFTAENAWTGPVPADAEIVTPEELQRRVARGEVTITSTVIIEATQAELQARFEADFTELEGFAGASPSFQALLDEAAGHESYEGDRTVELPNGEIVRVSGLGEMLREAVEAHETSLDVDNARDRYALTYGMLPEELQDDLTPPSALASATLEAVLQALGELENALSTSYEFVGVQEEQPFQDSLIADSVFRPGAGRDMDSNCVRPTGLAAGFWFPLKDFLPPVKNQGERGVCWAFTAIGAIESRELVQNDRRVNLSEQFLVHKVKLDWASNDYTDGYQAEGAVTGAANRNQLMINEAGWTYNPSPNMAGGTGAASYAGACDPYSNGPNGGSCSETSHQSPRVCAHGAVTVCSYVHINARGEIPANRALQIWSNGKPFDLAQYRLLLENGHVLMASFPVYSGFMFTPDGVVSDYRRTVRDAAGNETAGTYGNHAVMIVGFIPNEAMARPGHPTPNIGGGGYFIVQNSWGCGAGDGGYYYVPANYVQQIFNRLSILDFDSRRGRGWREAKAVPGGLPRVRVESSTVEVDVRVQTDLSEFFYVSHPVAKNVHLRAYHSTEGVLYDGNWNLETDTLIPNRLWHTFNRIGSGEVRLDVRYNGRYTHTGFRINVVNTPPTIGFDMAQFAYVGEPHAARAILIDKNEPDQLHMCSTARWSVGTGHTVSPATGCLTNITFGQTGRHTVTLSVTDRDGATTTERIDIDVLPPPANPYPRVTDPRVFAILSHELGCYNSNRAIGSTIDLRQFGCTLNYLEPVPVRHHATVSVENPSGEALTYDWRLMVRLDHEGAQWQVYHSRIGSTSASYPLRDLDRVTPRTADCYVTVTVNAPQANRSKQLTVWTGRCIATFGTNPR